MHKTSFELKTFDELYADNYARLYRVAVRMTDDRENAADVVQEVFTALYEKIRGGTVVLYPATWLYRATMNKCLDSLKRRNRHSGLEAAGDLADEPSSDKEDQERQVRKALDVMKPDERALLVLYGEGFSYKEIADSTGIRFTSVGKTLARTLVKMERQLKLQGYEMH